MKKLFLFLPLVLLASFVFADLGPKPSMDIFVNYEGAPVSDPVFYAVVLSCSPANFDASGKAVSELSPEIELPSGVGNGVQAEKLSVKDCDAGKGCCWQPARLAWGGECVNGACHFGYMLPEEFRLAVYVPSLAETFLTSAIVRFNFQSSFEVGLRANKVNTIKETTGFMMTSGGRVVNQFVLAFFLTVVIELLFFLIYLNSSKAAFEKYSSSQKRILVAVFLVNAVSLPLVWFGFPAVIQNALAVVLAAEAFAVVFEAVALKLLVKEFSFKAAFLLSLAANALSLIVGGFLFMFLSVFFFF